MMQLKRRVAFTLVEILIVTTIISLLASIAIPSVLRARTLANEAAAIGNLHTLMLTLEMYHTGNASYPGTKFGWQKAIYGADCDPATAPVPDYGPPSFCAAMSDSPIQGYLYTYVGGAAAKAPSYAVTADPITLGRTGTRAFFLDESGVIRHCQGATGATVASTPIHQPPTSSCP